MKFFSYLASILLVMVLSIQIAYQYFAPEISDFLIPSQNIYSQDIAEVLWVELGEMGDIRMDPTSPIGVVFSMARSVLTNNDGLEFSAGFNLSSKSSRHFLYDKPNYRGHLYGVVSAIWISNHWTTEQTIATTVDNASFRLEKKATFEDAAAAYFRKSSNQLTTNEIVTLITIMAGPSVFDPFCRTDKFMRRANAIQSQLIKNWPDKYAGYVFNRPEIIQPKGSPCSER